MAASFEIKSGDIRWGPEHSKLGDSWTSSASAYIFGTNVVVGGYSGEMRPSVVKDILREIKRKLPHVEKLTFVRYDEQGNLREGSIKMPNDKRYKVVQPPVQLIECGEDGFEKVVWTGEGNAWDGSYETGVIVQRHFKKFIDAMQAEGEARLKKGI